MQSVFALAGVMALQATLAFSVLGAAADTARKLNHRSCVTAAAVSSYSTQSCDVFLAQ